MTGPFVITRDGVLADDGVFTLDAGFSRMHRIQGQSVDYATTYGGYAFVDVGVTPRHYAHVGKLADGARVFVDWEVTPLDRPTTSVTHTPVTEGWSLSVTGGIVTSESGRRRDYDACGQILDTLADVVTFAPGWTPEDVASLASVWRDWHLNDMRAACAHMVTDDLVREPTMYGTRIATDARNGCPAGSGYVYGHAWLYAPIPAAVLLELSRLTALPAGRIPEWMTR